jgi:DNA-binding response OmpR family regulator
LFLEYLGVSSRTPENRQVHKLPGFATFSWPTLVRNVLILAREDLVAALLGLMVELHGYQPTFVDRSESVDDVIRRDGPAAVLIDCDHPDCTESLIEAIRRLDATPILFSPFRMQHEVRAVATHHGVQSFTLPADPGTFGKMLNT